MKRGKGPQMDSDPRESRREGKDSKGYAERNVARPLDHRLGAGYQNERAWANMAEDGRLQAARRAVQPGNPQVNHG